MAAEGVRECMYTFLVLQKGKRGTFFPPFARGLFKMTLWKYFSNLNATNHASNTKEGKTNSSFNWFAQQIF